SARSRAGAEAERLAPRVREHRGEEVFSKALKVHSLVPEEQRSLKAEAHRFRARPAPPAGAASSPSPNRIRSRGVRSCPSGSPSSGSSSAGVGPGEAWIDDGRPCREGAPRKLRLGKALS